MTMHLYGHLIDRNLRDAADRRGDTTGAFSEDGPEVQGWLLAFNGARTRRYLL